MGPKLLLLFIIGDILGTGIYALTGDVAAEVGGAAWLPFLVAFAVATVTAMSYLELVTKYPQAAGAALYTQKAFGLQSLTFLVAFVVMSSGITSAATASRAFAANLAAGFGLDIGGWGIVMLAVGFLALVAIVNYRGVGESVKANVVLTMVEMSGLALVIAVGLFAAVGGRADFSRVVAFETPGGQGLVPRAHDGNVVGVLRDDRVRGFGQHGRGDEGPGSRFPEGDAHRAVHHRPDLRPGLRGVGCTGPGRTLAASETPLVEVVTVGAPGLPIGSIMPFISMFAVANSALINMLMASRLVYGMARQRVVPPILGRVGEARRTPWVAILFTTRLGVRADHSGVLRQRGRGAHAGWHDRPVAARRVHGGQSGGVGAAS